MISGAGKISFIILLFGLSLLVALYAAAQTGASHPHVPSALWTGIVDGKLTETGTYMNEPYTRHYTVHIQVRLREYNKKPITGNVAKPPYAMRTVGWEFELWNEGTRMEETFEDGNCSGKGVTTYSDNEYPGGHIWWRSIDDAHVTSIYPFDINNIKFKDFPMEGTYGVGFGSCCWNSCPNYNENKDHPFGLGHDAVEIGMGLGHGPNYEYDKVLNPPINHRLNAAHTKMSGSFNITEPHNDGVGSSHLQVHWDICKQGSSGCIPLDTTASPVDPCPPPTSQLALLNLALNQEKELLILNGKQYGKILQLQQEAKQWKNDFEQASRDCKLWQAAQVLMNLLVGNKEIDGAGQELSNFLSFLDKLSSGDPSWLLPNTEYKNLFSTEDAWEGFQAAYGQIAPESKPEGLLDALRKCGAPTGSGVMEGAVNYLRLLQQIEPMAQAAQKTLNDIRNKDQEVFDLWNKYHEACVDRALCKGTDPAECDNPPPTK